jgi:hypothetical protein
MLDRSRACPEIGFFFPLSNSRQVGTDWNRELTGPRPEPAIWAAGCDSGPTSSGRIIMASDLNEPGRAPHGASVPAEGDIHRARLPGAAPRQAMWSCITGVAIVVILFVVFYGVNQRTETAKLPPPATATTIIQSSTPDLQTTGQSGARNESEPR